MGLGAWRSRLLGGLGWFGAWRSTNGARVVSLLGGQRIRSFCRSGGTFGATRTRGDRMPGLRPWQHPNSGGFRSLDLARGGVSGEFHLDFNLKFYTKMK
jgi:hypothetical protein